MRNPDIFVDISVPDGDTSKILWIPPRLHETDGVNFTSDFSEIIESSPGYSQRTRYSPQQRKVVKYTWDCVENDDRNTILDFYANIAQGKKNSFWMPLWTNWFDLPLGIKEGSKAVAIRPMGFDKVFPNWYYPETEFAPESLLIKLKNGGLHARPIVSCPTSNQLILEHPFYRDFDPEEIQMATRILRWNFASGISERMVSSIEGPTKIFEVSASFLQLSNNEEERGVFPYLDGVSGRARKYVLTENTREIMGKTLYQIRSLRYLNGVVPGDLGGWIESEDNLSHKGQCWIFPDAYVYDGSRIFGNARIKGNVEICNRDWYTEFATPAPEISGNVYIEATGQHIGVSGYVKIWDSVTIKDTYGVVIIESREGKPCEIWGEILIEGYFWVDGWTQIFGKCHFYSTVGIYDHTYTDIPKITRVCGNITAYNDVYFSCCQVSGNIVLHDFVHISDHGSTEGRGAIVTGSGVLFNDVYINGDAVVGGIFSFNHYVYILDSSYILGILIILHDDVVVYQSAQILGQVVIRNYCYIGENGKVSGNGIIVANDCNVHGNGFVYDKAQIYDYTTVTENGRVGGDAVLYDCLVKGNGVVTSGTHVGQTIG